MPKVIWKKQNQIFQKSSSQKDVCKKSQNAERYM